MGAFRAAGLMCLVSGLVVPLLLGAIPPNTTSSYQRILGYDGGATVPVEIVGAASGGGALPVYLTDGGLGTSDNPIRNDPVGSTAQPVRPLDGGYLFEIGLNVSGAAASVTNPVRVDTTGTTVQPVGPSDGGIAFTARRLSVPKDEPPACAPPCSPAVCNPDGGAGAFTLLLGSDATNTRQTGTIANSGGITYLELSKDAGVGILTQHPLRLWPGQSYSFEGYSGPWYGCCDSDGGCSLTGLVAQ